MRILVTGGSGLIGEALVSDLLKRGHQIRLLARHAAEAAREWEGVEPFEADIAGAQGLRGAAAGCDIVLHAAGIVEEEPPERTFQSVNVQGTANILAEARAAGAERFVYVSSLGADRGTSDYHRSKLEAERLVQGSGLQWTIVRPGSVYGPGDEVISTILKMVRALPAVPVIDDGEQPFQPIWHEDLAAILSRVAERADLAEQILEAAGPEQTTMNDLLRRFGDITGKTPVRVPVPGALARVLARVASIVVRPPVDENKLKMLADGNVLEGRNAATVVGVESTPLDMGLRLLADALPEVLPEYGVGSLLHKRFWADIAGSRHSAVSLMSMFRSNPGRFMPVDINAEPATPARADEGTTLTGSLPLRGNFQVRVELVEPTRVVLATVEGHPLAGIVEFTSADADGAVRFAVDVYARASNTVDWIAARTVGAPAQSANWRVVVQRMIEASGGTSDGVREEKETLAGAAAEAVERRARAMVRRRKQAAREQVDEGRQ